MLLTIGKGLLGAIIGLLLSLGFLFLAGDSIFNTVLGTPRGATDNGAAAYFVILVFAWVGLIVGAILIFRPWHMNRWLVLLLLILLGGNLYINRYLYIERPPRVEAFGNFELLIYEITTIPVYGLRYGGKPIAIEEQAGFLSDERESYTRFDTLLTLTIPTTITPPVFVVTVGDQYHDFFYLVHEVAGAAKVERLSNNTRATAQWLDVGLDVGLDVALGDPATPNNLLVDRASAVAGRWLLLGDNCVLDVHTLTAYSIDTTAFEGNTQVRLTGPPLAFSPDAQSFVRLAERDNGKFGQGGVPQADATLAVFHFVENSFYLLPVDRTQMRYHRNNEVDSQWLADYFAWQKSAQVHDQLVPRTDVAPLPYQSHFDRERLSFEPPRYYLGPVKPAMLERLVAFLEAAFAAVVDVREESSFGSHSITLKIGTQRIHLVYYEDSSPSGELRFMGDMDNESELLATVAQRFDEVLKTGIHDDLFLREGEEP